MLYAGQNPILTNNKEAKGQFITIEGERFYEIANYDAMQPFFISLASDTDLWMYLSSTGGLTAGRRSPEQALFPYYTDDKITEQYEQTGPKSIFHIAVDGKKYLWEPFSERMAGVYNIERKIAKSTVGNRIVFCEENLSLGLRFSYIWSPAGAHGWVRRATIENISGKDATITLLDGLQNVLPSGVERKTQNEFSTLVDGYKKTEWVEDTSLILFRMEAILVDRAEPSESLFCNTMYALGLPEARYCVCSRPLDLFRKGQEWDNDAYIEAKGERGAFLAYATITLPNQASRTWYIVADVQKDIVAVRQLISFSKNPQAIATIEQAIAHSTNKLQEIVKHNDGEQQTADAHNDARHFANTLFNTMRGGYYLNDYQIQSSAFAQHVRVFNMALADKHQQFLQSLPSSIEYGQLLCMVRKQNDNQLIRLAYEYLPITFGRRHGDPSRPWNLFDIRVQDEKGQPIVSYQGNWRDIFQNWEALSLSYPIFINTIISKFLNATTADGYNPYRITNSGIDWEVIEPDNPWSNIGYWGDHQIIYLLKLLELSYNHAPEILSTMLNERIFAFANIPYRLKPYEEIVADPKNSIIFDNDLHEHIFSLLPTIGQDAKLLMNDKQEIVLTTMGDKMLITLLAKLSNFIPNAGIWMNTLRPEWNDANNALVGYGASMVTLCYMRRYIAFLLDFIVSDITIGQETYILLQSIHNAFTQYKTNPDKTVDCINRKIVDALGIAGELYREKVYKGLSEQTVCLILSELQSFLHVTLELIDLSIYNNKRENGLYNAYNLIQFDNENIEISHLYDMLEGQVAVLTSGILTAQESIDLLDAMNKSGLYRADQRSYMLYPNRRRASFLELNNIPSHCIQMPIIQHLIHQKDTTIIVNDENGGLHFNAHFNNASFLANAIKQYNTTHTQRPIDNNEQQSLLELYEQVFNHHAFTGRSGTFYKYEGLGSIYWHMVSKLLLAVGETIARYPDASDKERAAFKQHYAHIQEGIGAHKQPAEYGSFPFDPYSHTPCMAGVQQPGMTGQVKEDIINRFFELGIVIKDGSICFTPQMISPNDFTKEGTLHFTYCAIPIIYHATNSNSNNVLAEVTNIAIQTAEKTIHLTGNVLPHSYSEHVFNRDRSIEQIDVYINF